MLLSSTRIYIKISSDTSLLISQQVYVKNGIKTCPHQKTLHQLFCVFFSPFSLFPHKPHILKKKNQLGVYEVVSTFRSNENVTKNFTYPSSRTPKLPSDRPGLLQSFPVCRRTILRWTWTQGISSRPYESITSRASRSPSGTSEWGRHSSRGLGHTYRLGSQAWTWRTALLMEWLRLKKIKTKIMDDEL